jgi:hypothetical protein
VTVIARLTRNPRIVLRDSDLRQNDAAQCKLIKKCKDTNKIALKRATVECIFPEGASPLCAGERFRRISKRQGGVKHALKEAKLQNPVLTNRNGIRSHNVWVSSPVPVTL